jgi:GNAT superfamily N-acetyltransferase
MSGFTIRRAVAGDEELVLSLLRELAVYEKIEERFKLTLEALTRDFLRPAPLCFCELAHVDSKPIGVMTWYRVYSSFIAARGIFLEDLYVKPEQRGQGYGRDLLAHLAKQAVSDGARFIEWQVLDWNKPSIDFYERLGATPLKGWLSYRLGGDALGDLAQT